MPEHEFPLDADPVLRKYVKMEIERETAEIKLGEMKARFISMAWRTLFFFVVAFAIWTIRSLNISLVTALVTVVGLSIISNLKPSWEIFSNWRDMMRAKKELRSWNEVITDYQNEIKEEDSLKEQQSIGNSLS